MKRTLLVTTALALLLGCHAADHTFSATDHTFSTSSTGCAQYIATFHVVEEQTIAPGGGAYLALPTANTWGFDSWLFFEVTIPTFDASSIELEPGEDYGQRVPVLTFEANPGWVKIEEDGERSVWFYTQPVESGAGFTPLFDQWTMPNFRVRSGQCGEHTYSEIIAAANEARVTRYSLQADGISGKPEVLWSMVK